MRWKPRRQDVDEEAADELVGCERHQLVSIAAFDPVVLPLEGDAVPVEVRSGGCWRWRRGGCSARDRPARPRVRRTGALNRRPIRFCAAAPDMRRRPVRRRAERDCRRTEAAGCAAMSFSRNSRRNRRESTRTGRKKPGRHDTQRVAVERDAAARHDHVHVRMMGQRRAPGVQHGGDADRGRRDAWGRPRS